MTHQFSNDQNTSPSQATLTLHLLLFALTLISPYGPVVLLDREELVAQVLVGSEDHEPVLVPRALPGLVAADAEGVEVAVRGPGPGHYHHTLLNITMFLSRLLSATATVIKFISSNLSYFPPTFIFQVHHLDKHVEDDRRLLVFWNFYCSKFDKLIYIYFNFNIRLGNRTIEILDVLKIHYYRDKEAVPINQSSVGRG